jgi:hypothetical protein
MDIQQITGGEGGSDDLGLTSSYSTTSDSGTGFIKSHSRNSGPTFDAVSIKIGTDFYTPKPMCDLWCPSSSILLAGRFLLVCLFIVVFM